MASRVPAVIAHPSVARAAVGPSAIALTAAGAGIGVLDHSLPLAVVLAVVGWGGRMGWAVIKRARRQRPAPPERVDPWSVAPPWRDHLRAAVDAQKRFDDALGSLPEGPTRDRVGLLAERIDRSVVAAAVTARRGALLSTPERSARANALSAELAGLDRHAALDPAALRHETVVAAQLRAMRRAEAVSTEALDQVRLLAARIDDAVTALVELSMEPTRIDATDGRSDTLLSVLDEIEALHAGMDASGAALESAALPSQASNAAESPGPSSAVDPDRRSATPDAPPTS